MTTVGGEAQSYTYTGDGMRLSAATGTRAEDVTRIATKRLPQLATESDGNDQLLGRHSTGSISSTTSPHTRIPTTTTMTGSAR